MNTTLEMRASRTTRPNTAIAAWYSDGSFAWLFTVDLRDPARTEATASKIALPIWRCCRVHEVASDVAKPAGRWRRLQPLTSSDLNLLSPLKAPGPRQLSMTPNPQVTGADRPTRCPLLGFRRFRQ